ncbi:MAG: hypothetical protein J0M29_02240 [Chitinophagales bacterium]|nr:hypothetical protein [Chitinophagales bacterium]
MRVIGYIEHPIFKISIFKNDGRTSVKFENELYEQTFKLGNDERFATVEGIQQWASPALLEKITDGFRLMHSANLAAREEAFPTDSDHAFEDII